MICDVIGEILGIFLEGALGSRKPEPRFPKSEENASIGAAAGALAFIALLTGIPGIAFAVGYSGVPGPGNLLVLGFGADSVLVARGTI